MRASRRSVPASGIENTGVEGEPLENPDSPTVSPVVCQAAQLFGPSSSSVASDSSSRGSEPVLIPMIRS